MIETVDSVKLGLAIDKACADAGKIMPILIEINSGLESGKAGVLPEEAEGLIRELGALSCLRVMGLMTMGPFSPDPEESRPYFQRTRDLFERIGSTGIPGAEMRYLSMGMSDSYTVALEEGANLVRIGTRIFGARG
jgi:hypothetical protein